MNFSVEDKCILTSCLRFGFSSLSASLNVSCSTNGTKLQFSIHTLSADTAEARRLGYDW